MPCTISFNTQELGLDATQFDSGFFRLVLFIITRILVCNNITGILVFPKAKKDFETQVYLMATYYRFEELKE